MTKHAILRPSGFKAIMLCPAKPAMERGKPDRAGKDAQEGTNAHTLAAICLQKGIVPRQLVAPGCLLRPEEGEPFVITEEMIDAVTTYVNTVRDRVEMHRMAGALRVDLHIEQAVPIGHITGEVGAEGTSDAVITAVYPDGVSTDVIDLKYGKGVEVSAGTNGDEFKPNPQLALYALGAIEKFSALGEITEGVLLIVQPRINSVPSGYCFSTGELLAWAEDVAKPAARIATQLLNGEADTDAWCWPHEEACRWCKAKSDCPGLAAQVEYELSAEFTDLTTQDKPEQGGIVRTLVAMEKSTGSLGARLDAVPLIELWCKAIREEAEKVLLAGGEVPGYKLVQERRPPRAWVDESEAEAKLKGLNLKQSEMYERKLISPTTAEKLFKADAERWKQVLPLIRQGEGSPSVAPIANKRPALQIKPIEDEFEAITETAEDLI